MKVTIDDAELRLLLEAAKYSDLSHVKLPDGGYLHTADVVTRYRNLLAQEPYTWIEDHTVTLPDELKDVEKVPTDGWY